MLTPISDQNISLILCFSIQYVYCSKYHKEYFHSLTAALNSSGINQIQQPRRTNHVSKLII